MSRIPYPKKASSIDLDIRNILAYLEATYSQIVTPTLSTGSMIVVPTAEIPNIPGVLKCNHQAVSRSNYSALFTLVGTTFGAGNGTTTFNVPNISDPVTGASWIIYV